MSLPKQLQLEEYFKCPIWWADEPKFVKKLNKASPINLKYQLQKKRTKGVIPLEAVILKILLIKKAQNGLKIN